MPSILLIDDNKKLLDELEAAVSRHLNDGQVEIRTWNPTRHESNPLAWFEGIVDRNTILVITDYDLTTQGQTGLFGSSIVGWCQTWGIPVGDFSRGNPGNLPKEPDLFEIRIPTRTDEAASFIAALYRGFRDIRNAITTREEIFRTKRSPAAVLAEILGDGTVESQFALYSVRLGATNASLVEKIVRTAPKDKEPTNAERNALLAYIVGHLLLNAVLRFPGPILSLRTLMAYLSINQSDQGDVVKLFDAAKYTGPFSEVDQYFWLSKVDDILEALSTGSPFPDTKTQGEFHRLVVEAKLGRQLVRHECDRCNGVNGGFLCPFTDRTVCQLPECSVGANSWIPQGAKLCRIERTFYDEWSPILGI